jgi:hypothetical protein
MAKELNTVNDIPVNIPNNFSPTSDIMQNANRALLMAENRKKELHKIYKEEEKVPMYLSPMYKAYVGNVMRVMINGISIFFKVDGSTQLVPKTFADEIVARRLAIDAILTKQSRMANISANNESNPGELNLF